MSDDLFEGPEPNFQPDQPSFDNRGRRIKAPDPLKIAQRAADVAQYMAEQAELEQQRKDEYKAIVESVKDPANDEFVGLWYGLIPTGTTLKKHIKHICGTPVADERILRPSDHPLLQGGRLIVLGDKQIAPKDLKRVAILRLTMSQMIMAKLNRIDTELVEHDTDGQLWAAFSKLLGAARLKRDLTFYDKEFNALVERVKKLF